MIDILSVLEGAIEELHLAQVERFGLGRDFAGCIQSGHAQQGGRCKGCDF